MILFISGGTVFHLLEILTLKKFFLMSSLPFFTFTFKLSAATLVSLSQSQAFSNHVPCSMPLPPMPYMILCKMHHCTCWLGVASPPGFGAPAPSAAPSRRCWPGRTPCSWPSFELSPSVAEPEPVGAGTFLVRAGAGAGVKM